MTEQTKALDPVVSSASKDADQGTTPIVNLEKTTGSLWADQQAAAAKDLEKDPTVVQAKKFEEIQAIAHEGSVLYDADAKKAALLQTDTTPVSYSDASKAALKATAKLEKAQQEAIDAEHSGNVLYDAEAKKAALIGGNKSAVKVKK